MNPSLTSTAQPPLRRNVLRRPDSKPRATKTHRDSSSRVDRAFQMMGTWGNSSPECSLYDLARASR